MADRDWHKALRSRDLHAGEVFPAVAGRQRLMVARLSDGRAVAFSARCPHQATDLQDATVWEDNIRCPRHQYIYDPATGKNVHPTNRFGAESLWKLKPGYLPVYAVEERRGWIWVSARPLPPPADWDPALEEPPPGAEAEELHDEALDNITTEAVETVQVRLGASFELHLPTNPLPGHTWDVTVAGGMVEVMEEGLSSDDPPRWQARLAALTEGEDQVRCEFRAPWDVEPSEVRRYVVQVLPPD